MKAIIAGSRSITDYKTVEDAVYDAYRAHPNLVIDEVVSGGAAGADRLGEQFAKRMNIPIKYFYPDYRRYQGKVAPLVRNQQMVDYVKPDGVLVAVWDGKSRGTRDIIQRARQASLRVHVREVA